MHGQNINLPVCVCVCLRPLNGFLQSILWQLKRRGFTQGCAFWGSRWSHLGVQSPPKTPIFGGLNMHFKPYMRKIQTAISSDLCIRLTWNLTGSCGQQQRLRGWSHGGKTIPRWRTAAILKIVILPYLSEKSSDFHEFCTQQQILNWMNVTWSKMKKVALDILRVRQNVFLVLLNYLPFSDLSIVGLPLTRLTIVLQLYDTVGWVIWPAKSSPQMATMTYNVSSGILNPTILVLSVEFYCALGLMVLQNSQLAWSICAVYQTEPSNHECNSLKTEPRSAQHNILDPSAAATSW